MAGNHANTKMERKRKVVDKSCFMCAPNETTGENFCCFVIAKKSLAKKAHFSFFLRLQLGCCRAQYNSLLAALAVSLSVGRMRVWPRSAGNAEIASVGPLAGPSVRPSVRSERVPREIKFKRERLQEEGGERGGNDFSPPRSSHEKEGKKHETNGFLGVLSSKSRRSFRTVGRWLR